MLDSFEEFKTAIHTALRDKVSERLNTEREYISNSLLRGNVEEDATETPDETQSNEAEN